MLQTDNVAESLQCNSRKPEVTKLPVAVQIGGIENDMIMNMCPVHMGCHDKSMLPFCESHTGFIPYFICFLRCDFTRLERLADLICKHISLRLPPCFMQIFFFLPEQIPDQPAPDYTDKMRYIFHLPSYPRSLHNLFYLSGTASRSVLCSDALLSVLLPPFSHLPYIIAVNLSSTFLISCNISF